MGPLSGKQHREWLKFSAKESRESAKMEKEESRKDQLHEVKLMEAAAKAHQGIGHKEELHGLKVNELGGPLGNKPRMNREKLGLPSSNPMSGTGMFKQGQHMLAQGTDTVPAMLTPGEAVIPRAAAQDPRNKPMIAKMVQQGRQAQHHARGTTGVVDIPHQLAMLPTVKPVKKRMGYEDGTLNAQYEQMYNPDKYAEGSMNVVYKDGKACYADGTTSAHELEMAPNVNADGSIYNGIPMMHGGYVPHYENGVENVSGYDVGGGFNPAGIQDNPEDRFQRAMKGTEWYSEFNKEYGEPPDLSKNANYDYRKAWDAGIMPERSPEDNNKYHWPSSTPNGSMLKSENHPTAWKEYYMRATGRNPDTEDGLDETTMRNVADKYKAGQEGQPKPVNIAEVSPVPKATVAVVPTPTAVPPDLSIDTVSEVNNMDRNKNPEAAPAASASRSLTPPPKFPPKGSEEDRTNPDYWIKQFKGANSDVEKAADRYKNDDKGFIESFKNIFSYKGLKDTLGLNNQEVARMAVMYLGSRARGYNSARSFSFAGKNAFETSLQRQGRESAEIAADRRAEKSDDRAVRTAAVQMAGQEKRYQIEDQRVIAKERKDEMTKLTADRKELRKEYEKDRDRFEDFASKDVPMNVRNQAFSLAYAPLKSKEPEDRIEEQRNNLRKATVLMSMNVQHKDKGNTVNMPSPVQQVTLVTDSNGVAVNAIFDPRAPVNQRYTTLDGSPLDMSKYSFKGTEELNTSKLKSAISSSIPETIKNEKGEDVKNYNKPQLVEATHNVLYNMGMTKANDTQVARIVNDAYQHLVNSKMPINQENLELAIQTNVIKTGANSPLMEVKSDTTNNKNFLSKGNTQQQLEAGHEVGRLAKQAQAANKTLDITPAVMAKNIEDNWADLKKNNPKAYNKFLDDAPLGKSPALEYYKSLIAKQNKKD